MTNPNPSRIARWLFLLAGGATLFAAGAGDGHVLSALCAWIPPVLLLRYTRLSRPWSGYLGVVAVSTIAMYVLWRGMIPVPAAAYAIVCLITGLISGLPYLIDRCLNVRVRGLASTLIFPAAMVFIGYAASLRAPFGTWGNVAYSQAELPALFGVVSLAGLWGVVFLMSWFAACVNGMLSKEPVSGRVAPAVAWCSTLIILLLACIWLPQAPARSSVRVAAIKPTAAQPSMFDTCKTSDIACRQLVSRTRQQALFDDSEMAVQQGASILLWSEGAAEVLQADEPALIERGRQFAREHRVYLGMTVLAVPDDFPKTLLDDKLVLVTPDGGIAWQYRKNKPVPGEPILSGDGRMPVLETPFGRIATAICFDADFPALIHLAAQQHADFLLVAAADWPRIASLHARMAVFRARENGMALLRATGTYPQRRIERSMGISTSVPGPDISGISLAVAGDGIVVKQDQGTGGVLIADLKTQGHWTPYRTIGDSLPWTCLFFLIGSAVWPRISRARTR